MLRARFRAPIGTDVALEIGVGTAKEGPGFMDTTVTGDAVAATTSVVNEIGETLAASNYAMRRNPGGVVHEITAVSSPPPPPLEPE